MTFFRAEMLFFIWTVPVLLLFIFYGVRRRRDILKRYATLRSLAIIAPAKSHTRRWIKAALLMAVLLFTAVALAGPQYGFRWQEINQRGVDIVIALDCSRSMTAADIQPNRLERAKREVYDLLTMLEGDRVALVAFAGTAFLQCPLTLDYNAFNLFLNALSPDYLPVGGTNITMALETAVNSFEPESATDRAVILITDGENTGSGDPIKAAEALKEEKIKLFCIGVGSGEGVPIPEAEGGFKKDPSGQIVLSRLDETTLKQMAVITGGTYVRSVAGDMDLDAIYTDEIRRKMDAQTLTSGRKQVWEDRFQWPLALALICLAAELLLPVTRKTIFASLFIAATTFFPFHPVQANDTRDGITAYDKGDFDAALKHFTDAQLNDPESPERLYNVAGAYYKIGDFEAAADHYRQVLEAAPDEMRPKALYNLGNAEFKRGNAKEAIGHYEAALAIDPDNRLAKENLEFVKKVLEQQQQQSQDGQQDQNQEKQGDKDDSQKNQSQESSSDEKQQEKTGGRQQTEKERQNDFGDEMDQQQTQQQQEQSGEDRQKAPSAHQSQASSSEEVQGDPGQAERMLNRLQDQPGRALMPAGKRSVEKDW
jgi:Ca-activated chloride channel family protein